MQGRWYWLQRFKQVLVTLPKSAILATLLPCCQRRRRLPLAAAAAATQ